MLVSNIAVDALVLQHQAIGINMQTHYILQELTTA